MSSLSFSIPYFFNIKALSSSLVISESLNGPQFEVKIHAFSSMTAIFSMVSRKR